MKPKQAEIEQIIESAVIANTRIGVLETENQELREEIARLKAEAKK